MSRGHALAWDLVELWRHQEQVSFVYFSYSAPPYSTTFCEFSLLSVFLEALNT